MSIGTVLVLVRVTAIRHLLSLWAEAWAVDEVVVVVMRRGIRRTIHEVTVGDGRLIW
jgi:hypothetical protein